MVRLPYVMLILAIVLAYAPKAVVAYAMLKQQGKYDNAHPRAAYTTLTGFGARALAAHLNGVEAFAPFAVGVITCIITGVDIDSINLLSVGFVALRAAFIVLYLANVPTLRSAVWGLGALATLTLMGLPLLR